MLKFVARWRCPFGILALVVLSSCVPTPHPQAEEQRASAECQLPDGRYPVQSAALDTETGAYQLFLLGAPSCLKQPVQFDDLKLARNPEGEKEKAVMVQDTSGQSLYMNADYQIRIASAAPGQEGGQGSGGEPSFWSPFLSGMAGAAIGGMVMNSMFNRPRYYTPPPAPAQGGVMRGIGSSGETKKEAIATYRKRHPQDRTRFAKQSGFLKRSPNKRTSSSFFKKKSASSKGMFKSKSRSRRR